MSNNSQAPQTYHYTPKPTEVFFGAGQALPQDLLDLAAAQESRMIREGRCNPAPK